MSFLVTTPESGSMVLLPYQPEAPMTESLEWLTCVMKSSNGLEELKKLRRSPRRTLSMSLPVPRSSLSEVSHLLIGGRTRNCAMPLWNQAQVVTAVASTDLIVGCETSYSEFSASGLALLWSSPSTWSVLRVSSVSPGQLNLAQEVGSSFASALLMPMTWGFWESNPERLFTGSRTTMQVSLISHQPSALDPAAPEQYLGNDVYYEEVYQLQGSGSETVSTEVLSVDFDLGTITQYYPWDDSLASRKWGWVCETPEEQWSLREWLHRRSGQYRPFWAPTHEADIELLTTGSLGSVIRVRSNGYSELGSARSQLAFQSVTGEWQARTVNFISSPAPGELELTLSSALTGLSDVTLGHISLLRFQRLSSDRAQIVFSGGGVATAELGITERRIAA